MLITQNISWPTTNWPLGTPANQYTILQVYPVPLIINQTVTGGGTQATLTYDDTLAYVFQVRPSSGTAPSLTYGAEVATLVINYVPCRAWLRQSIRMALSDRTDTGNAASVNWPDDEINKYITEGMNELNLMFPIESSTKIMLLPSSSDTSGHQVGTRTYPLPADFYLARSVEYVTTDEKFHLFLKEKPWRGGETTAQSVMAYPKLGIWMPPQTGRFFPGHYFTYQGQLNLDWDPVGDGDYINLSYMAKRPIPVNDADLLSVQPEDMELLSLYSQMKCWLRVEGQDTRLSRWRSKDDGSRRDDLPTIKHSMIIKQLYNERVNDRRELRPRVRRLVRR